MLQFEGLLILLLFILTLSLFIHTLKVTGSFKDKYLVMNSTLSHFVNLLRLPLRQSSPIDLSLFSQKLQYICKIAFGFDPCYLSPSLPKTEFATAFDDALRISGERLTAPFPSIWKLKKLINTGSEKRLKQATSTIRMFAQNIVRTKKQELHENSSLENTDLLSRILNSGHSDDDFVIDMVISFIVAGRDTTSAALTWYFWLISCNSYDEKALLEEIREKPSASVYDEVKHMVYTHASLCESMRLSTSPFRLKRSSMRRYSTRWTVVKKGMRVTYHPYSMGRMENLWGQDLAEFKPERWLKKDDLIEGNWNFVAKDPYTYPVFQAGPRICLGKDMAFLQMKRVVAGVLRRFRVVPVTEEGFQPVLVSYMTSKMKDGFPVRIEERELSAITIS